MYHSGGGSGRGMLGRYDYIEAASGPDKLAALEFLPLSPDARL